MKERLLANLYIAVDAVLSNKMRSLLTALGIIFGVAAVIAMLAIGNGAQQEILEQIRLVGVNNIVVKPIVEQREEKIEETASKEKRKFSPGLTLRDVNSIRANIPVISKISPEILLETFIIKGGVRRSAKLVGVDPVYFEIFDFTLAEGRMFLEDELINGSPVCIIGNSIKSKFFPTEDPLGKAIKVGPHWLTIVGVMRERLVSQASIAKLGIRDYNMDVYTPLQTMLIRYENRDLVTRSQLSSTTSRGQYSRGQVVVQEPETEEPTTPTNYHQLDRLVIQVAETPYLQTTAEILSRLLERRHYGVVDYEIEIPELLLKQQQRTNDIFNYVLGAIAGISLLVGGIGIMNIMLVSVTERTREIGIRLAIGALEHEVLWQFLVEAVVLSSLGGLIGVLLATGLSFGLALWMQLPYAFDPGITLIAFAFSALVGVVFGYFPARRAAQLNPIDALRTM